MCSWLPNFQILFICGWGACRECISTVAFKAAMCTFVTISEKRGIVCSEHMLVLAAVIEATVNTVTWISLDQWLEVCAPYPALQCVFWELVKLLLWTSRVCLKKAEWWKRQKIDQCPISVCLSNIWWPVRRNREGWCVPVLFSTKAILGLLVVSTFHREELHLALMWVWITVQTNTNIPVLFKTHPFYKSINQRRLIESRLLKLYVKSSNQPHPSFHTSEQHLPSARVNPHNLPLVTSPAGQGHWVYMTNC